MRKCLLLLFLVTSCALVHESAASVPHRGASLQTGKIPVEVSLGAGDSEPKAPKVNIVSGAGQQDGQGQAAGILAAQDAQAAGKVHWGGSAGDDHPLETNGNHILKAPVDVAEVVPKVAVAVAGSGGTETGSGEAEALAEGSHAQAPRASRVSVATVAVLTLLMAAATGLGALPFFFVELDAAWGGVCNGMACGVMLAASFDLVKEGQEYGGHECVVAGILLGGLFILVSQKILDRCGEVSALDLKGADARKMVLVIAIMTLHSFGEGSGVGVSFAGPKGLSQGLLVTISIAVHNIPEGLAVAMVMASKGVSPRQAMLWSTFTSLPQPLVAVPAYICTEMFRQFLPLCMGFAAGCMIWIVFGEVAPEAVRDANPGSVATAATMSVAFMEMVGFLIKDLDHPPSWEKVAPFLWSLLFALGPLLGGLLVLLHIRLGPPFLLSPPLLSGVASGVMLALAAWRPLQVLVTGKVGLLATAGLLYAGSLLYMGAVRLLGKGGGRTSVKDNSLLPAQHESLLGLSPVARAALLASGAVGLHALTEGLYLGVAAPNAQGMGMYMLLPVALHGLPRGLAVAAAAHAATGSWRMALMAAALVGAGGPAGALGAMVAGLDYRGLDYWMLLACGALGPAAWSSLLPRAMSLDRRRATWGVALGVGVVIMSVLSTRMLCVYTPFCNSAPEAVT